MTFAFSSGFILLLWPDPMQVLGGGKCLVTFTPEQAITHEIEVLFNNEQVPGSPFLCRVKVRNVTDCSLTFKIIIHHLITSCTASTILHSNKGGCKIGHTVAMHANASAMLWERMQMQYNESASPKLMSICRMGMRTATGAAVAAFQRWVSIEPFAKIARIAVSASK